MQIGMIGLGRMGGNMVRRLHRLTVLPWRALLEVSEHQRQLPAHGLLDHV